MKFFASLCFCAVFLFEVSMVQAQALYQDRPKIGLVLSGGGAKGGAHIGVLKVIDELNIPIDLVVGTSMGAVVGGLYASGYSADEIEKLLTEINWESILRSKIDRTNLYYRRKRDDDIFLVKEVLGYGNGEVQLPKGVVQGHKLYQSFKQLTIGKEPLKNFDSLSIPFAAVSTDLITGNKVVLRQGDLAEAMYGSMAVPGIFPPVEINGKVLIDGGVVNNVPIEVAKEMGADILIVVDVGAPLYTKEQIKSFADVLDQLSNIYVLENVDKSLALLSDDDILIRPELGDISTVDFHRISDTIKPGQIAARHDSVKLTQLSYGQPAKNSPANSIYIKRSRVYNDSSLCTDTIYEYLPKEPGVYSTCEIDQYISKLYGLSFFEKINYGIENDELYVKPLEKRWGPTYIQSALLLGSDFDGGSFFNFGLGITRTLLNPLAGEYRLFGSIGRLNSVRMSLYQPITTDLKWFIEPRVSYERQRFEVSLPMVDVSFSEYQTHKTQGDIALGRNFGEWGRASIGYSRAAGQVELNLGIPIFTSSNFNDGFGSARLEWDVFDNSYFPNNGTIGAITYTMHNKHLGADQKFNQIQSRAAVAKTFGKHTLLVLGEYNATLEGTPTFNRAFQMGGLFRLSGYTQDQLLGVDTSVFDAIYYYRVKNIKLIPNYPFPLYVGFSAEAGNAWLNHTALFKHSFIASGSVFLGFDTILGPIYLGYGMAENGRKAAHVALGKLF